ncbi:MAG TPA: amidohydrolase family protein [Methylomirabilota bacterium]|jgi:imidazolonepropionase-like amidohydrolase|nr:amidohydrolase family protein [Methylomirabilota bacterium]
MRLYLKNLRLIDGTGAPARAGAALIIEGDTLVHVGPLAATDEPRGSDVETMDLDGRTVIPGLVEAHIHLSYNHVKVIADLDLNCPPEYSTLKAARNAELALACGYTAARSAGAVHRIDAALKQAINEGLYPGPRLLAASRDICATGGMADWNPSYLKLGMEGLALIADGPDEVRAAVRRSIKDGADVVKCYVGGDALLPHTPIGDCTYTLAEVVALVDESHMRGRMTAAHVRGQRSSRVAAEAGVDSLEHATYADDETLGLIADRGLTLVPGLRYLYSILENGPAFGIGEEIIGPSGLRDEIKQAADTYRRAKDLGIRMCPGGDFGFAWNPHGEYAKDIQVFVDVIGYSPLEAISCATRNGAELMRMADRIGTLQPGKLADLVVVDGDPLRDISVLQDRPRLSVMQGGRFVTRNF